MTDPTARNRSRRDALWCYAKNDLAAKNPDELKEMQALFKTEAEKYRVLPPDNSSFVGLLSRDQARLPARPLSRSRVKMRRIPGVCRIWLLLAPHHAIAMFSLFKVLLMATDRSLRS